MNTKFYTFDQNNSGGYFVSDKETGITATVIIEAIDHIHANERAEQIGLYFDGCATGEDCDCCGDRWGRSWQDDGDDVPSRYGKPVSQGDNERPCFTSNIPPIAVHYLDGRIEWY